MPKPLFFVLPAALLLVTPIASAGEIHASEPAQSSSFASPEARETWMRQAIGNILEGAGADRAQQTPKAEPR